MTTRTIKERLVDRFLDPSSSLGEIVFGLIMVLTMTLGAGDRILVEAGDTNIYEMF